MNSSGEWRGYFTYAKTTGSKIRFTADMQFIKSGENQLIVGEGQDPGGKFEIKDGIITGKLSVSSSTIHLLILLF